MIPFLLAAQRQLVMRCKLFIVVLLNVFSHSFSVAGDPHPYLLAGAKEVQLPKSSEIKIDLVPNVLTYSFRARRYTIDSKMRDAYPMGMKEVSGPSNEGFIINISVGPKTISRCRDIMGSTLNATFLILTGKSGCTDTRHLKAPLLYL